MEAKNDPRPTNSIVLVNGVCLFVNKNPAMPSPPIFIPKSFNLPSWWSFASPFMLPLSALTSYAKPFAISTGAYNILLFISLP